MFKSDVKLQQTNILHISSFVRYAIDWLQAENRVRVMLGAGGRIMCDLSLPDDGNDTEHIKLLSVEGTTSPVDICQIKVGVTMVSVHCNVFINQTSCKCLVRAVHLAGCHSSTLVSIT